MLKLFFEKIGEKTTLDSLESSEKKQAESPTKEKIQPLDKEDSLEDPSETKKDLSSSKKVPLFFEPALKDKNNSLEALNKIFELHPVETKKLEEARVELPKLKEKIIKAHQENKLIEILCIVKVSHASLKDKDIDAYKILIKLLDSIYYWAKDLEASKVKNTLPGYNTFK